MVEKWQIYTIFIILIVPLFFLVIISGCAKPNPNINLTADMQQIDGSITQYQIAFKITNNGNDVAKNVQIDHYSYCLRTNGVPDCINNSIPNIGILQPHESKIQYINISRSEFSATYLVLKNYHLDDYNASSE
mgnify:CR=1 FL=1